MASAPNEFVAYVLEVMSEWATVSARKMFGGQGLYRDGLMFALVVEDELFLKTDALTVASFEKEGCHPFTYQSKSRIVQVAYWSASSACLESPAEMGVWCQLAYAAALRGQVAKKPKDRKAT